MAHQMGIEESLPIRETRLRKNVQNDPMAIPAYYKRKVFEEYLNKILLELEMRYSREQNATFKLQYLLPQFDQYLTYDAIKESLVKYEKFFTETEETVVEPELQRWKNRNGCRPESNLLSDILASFGADPTFRAFYPTVYTGLKILATLPVTTAAAER